MVQSTSHLLNVLLKNEINESCVGITAENSPELELQFKK